MGGTVLPMTGLKGRITGLKCAACAEAAKRAISTLPGVEEAAVSGISGHAVIHGEVDPEAVAQVVGAAGFQWHDADLGAPTSPLHDHGELKSPYFQMAVAWVGVVLGFAVFRSSLSYGDVGVLVTLILSLGLAGKDLLAEFWTTLHTRNYKMETLIGIGVLGAVGHHFVSVLSTFHGLPVLSTFH